MQRLAVEIGSKLRQATPESSCNASSLHGLLVVTIPFNTLLPPLPSSPWIMILSVVGVNSSTQST